MRAAVLVDHTPDIQVRDVRDPDLVDDAVIVRVTATGVCRTDLHIASGDWSWLGTSFDLPMVLGHEAAGVVDQVGAAVSRFRVGDRVIVPFHIVCGRCLRCMTGQSNLCARVRFLGGALPGSFAALMSVPAADVNCVPLPDDVTDEVGAALGCRYMTAFHAVRGVARLAMGEYAVVFGAAGGIGLSTVQIAAAYGGRVVAVDRGEDALRAAADAGASYTIDASLTSDLAAAVREMTEGGAQVTFDAVAVPATTVAAVESLAPGGRHVQIGMTSASESGEIALPVDLIVARELSFLGVTGNPHSAYAELLHLVRSRRCAPDSLITRRTGLDGVPGVLEDLRHNRVRGFAIVEPAR